VVPKIPIFGWNTHKPQVQLAEQGMCDGDNMVISHIAAVNILDLGQGD
jgi:hypothetical protein